MRKPTLRSQKLHCHTEWANQVKKRDGFRCVICQVNEGLEAHHWIVPAGKSLATRFIIDNGATLCARHHRFGVHAGERSTILALITAMSLKVNNERATQIEDMRHAIVKWGISDLTEILDGLKKGEEAAPILELYKGEN